MSAPTTPNLTPAPIPSTASAVAPGAATGTAVEWAARYGEALMGTYGTPQRVLVRGEGPYVWDADGHAVPRPARRESPSTPSATRTPRS